MKTTEATPRLKKVDFGATPPVRPQPPPQVTITACPDCGGKVSVNARTCPHCGLRAFSGAHAVLGWLLQGIGLAGGLYFLLLANTAVDGVSNAGLLNDRLCGIVCSGALFIAGAIWASRA